MLFLSEESFSYLKTLKTRAFSHPGYTGDKRFSRKDNYNEILKKKKTYIYFMVEPLLSGIILGLVPVTIAGLFVTAYLQYRRGDLASF